MYAMARIVLVVSDNEYLPEMVTIFDSTIITCPNSNLFFSLSNLGRWEIKNRCEIKSAKCTHIQHTAPRCFIFIIYMVQELP